MEIKNPKKNLVALFLPSLRGGGAERVMVNLARGFRERGLPVDLVLAKAEGPYLADVPEEVRIIDLGARRVLYALPKLVRYLRQEKPKAMLSTLTHANIVAIWARIMSRVPARLVIREANTLSLSAQNAKDLRGKMMPMLASFFYRYADIVVAISLGVANDLVTRIRLPRDRIKVIYNPVITREIFAKAEEPLHHPWFQPGEPPVILGVGRLTKQKDFPTLIRAFALVRRECQARLMILGEGEARSQLETLVQQLGLEHDVALPGFVENPYKYMKRAALFVLSSNWEGLPNALIEALALGTRVISTDCPGGPREILENGRLGRLVPVGDVAAMASAISDALRRYPDNTVSKMLEESLKRFELGTIVTQYVEVLLGKGSL